MNWNAALHEFTLPQPKHRRRDGFSFNLPDAFHHPDSPYKLLPLRSLVKYRDVPAGFPIGIAPPQPPCVGNDYRALLSAAAAVAAGAETGSRRVHVVWSPGAAQPGPSLTELLTWLRTVDFDGRVDLTLCEVDGRNIHADLPGHGAIWSFGAKIGEALVLAHLHQMAADADYVLFLTGRVTLDRVALKRLLFPLSHSDRVLVALVDAGREGLELYTAADRLLDRFGGAHPHREIEGLNLALSSGLLRDAGGLGFGGAGTFLTAADFALRCCNMGAWVVPIAVPRLAGYDDREGRVQLAPPTVAVMIPAFGACEGLDLTLECLLDQDIDPGKVEICLLAAESADPVMARLRTVFEQAERLRWLDLAPGTTVGAAMNKAIAMSAAPYIAVIRPGDYLEPMVLREAVGHLEHHPEVAAAYCDDAEHADQPSIVDALVMPPAGLRFQLFRRSAWGRTTGLLEGPKDEVGHDFLLKMFGLGAVHRMEGHLAVSARRPAVQDVEAISRCRADALQRLGLRHWEVNSAGEAGGPYRLKAGTKFVVCWPNYRAANAYQRLLYAELAEQAEVVAGDIHCALNILQQGIAPAGDVVFHIHWLNRLFRSDCRETTLLHVTTFLNKVAQFVARGGRVIWTIHNFLVHDGLHPDLEIQASTRLAELAHIVHIHSAGSAEEISAHFAIAPEKIRVHRHGHYIGVYPDFIDRTTAREVLGLATDDDVILLSGMLRPYKGASELVDVFRGILAERPRARLVLAGQAASDPLADVMPALTPEELARIKVFTRYIDEGEMQIFFRAADFAVYPYRRALTSGSMMLALSFGVPVAIPRLAMTAEVLEGQGAGVLYNGGHGSMGLDAALRELLAAKDSGRLDTMARRARALAGRWGWPNFLPVVQAASSGL